MLRRNRSKNRIPIFSRVGLFFYDRPRFSVLIWLAIFIFGITSYTTLLKREGFPSIDIPYSMVSGSYLVNNAAKVDNDVTKPLSQLLVKQDKVKTVDAQAGANFYSIAIQFQDGTNSKTASANLRKAVEAAHVLPADATVKYQPISPGVDQRGDDILLAFYTNNSQLSTNDLYIKAQDAVKAVHSYPDFKLAQSIEVIDPFARGIDQATGLPAISQQTFDRFGIRQNGDNKFYKSVAIGIKGVKGFDVLKLDSQLQRAIEAVDKSSEFQGFKLQVSYSPATDINDQVNSLQHSLLDGLLAVLVVSALMVALRASLITVSAMAVVLVTNLGLLYLIGFSLNTITLFSLILCLSLIVDDTIIMVEAIDAQRRRVDNARVAVAGATRKISRAMIAATITATIGFAPLIFVSGILGSFIREIPVTVIASLLISLVVALTFIPFLARFLLLRKGQLGIALKNESPAHHLERAVAKTLSRPILWTRHHRRRQFGLGLTAVLIGFGFIVAGALLFQKVTFNLFPATKDSDQLMVSMTFAPNQNITQTQKVTDQVDQIVADNLGNNFEKASYYDSGSTNSASMTVDILSFKKRKPTAPELAKHLQAKLSNLPGAQIQVAELGVGSGPNDTAFMVRIESDNTAGAYRLAKDMSDYMKTAQLKRLNGSVAHFKDITISNPDTINRNNTKKYVQVGAQFDGEDTSALVSLAQSAIKDKYGSRQLASYNLASSAINFDTGTQGDFQNSFNTLLYAFPILLVLIYVLLVTQFRSLLQPLLIFMAIPFSFLGITAGLWLTHNPFSFFTMLGFFALLGLSIKNTILLTDYANQAHRDGYSPIEAVAISLQERFRPLVATSLTAIVSLIPLYLTNPFWEGLTVTLMFGLLSSTFLVITVFPYYYLGGEYLRLKISRKAFGVWLVLNILLIGLAVVGHYGKAVPLILLLTTLILPLAKLIIRKVKRKRS